MVLVSLIRYHVNVAINSEGEPILATSHYMGKEIGTPANENSILQKLEKLSENGATVYLTAAEHDDLDKSRIAYTELINELASHGCAA